MADQIQNPDDWPTATDPASDPQYNFYKDLASKAGEAVKPQGSFTKASISKEIDRLKNSQTQSAGN